MRPSIQVLGRVTPGDPTMRAPAPGIHADQSDTCLTPPVRDSRNPDDPGVDVGADAWTAFTGPLPAGEVVEPGHGTSKVVTASALSTRAAAKSSWRITKLVQYSS